MIDCTEREPPNLSRTVFSSFVKCPTKNLLAIGEPAPGAFFVDIEARISSMYKPVAKRQLQTRAKVAELLELGSCGAASTKKPADAIENLDWESRLIFVPDA